jgi:hypothetical protein
MKNQKIEQPKRARNLSDRIIERRYLDLQKLRDVVRKAEMNCVAEISKKSERSKPSARVFANTICQTEP